MIAAFGKALGQLPERSFRFYLLISLTGSLALLVGLIWLAGWALSELETGEGWLNWLVTLAGGLGATFAAWLLLPTVSTTIAGFMLSGVARAVERRHYPHLAPAREAPLIEDVWVGVRIALLTLAINLAALPFYIATIWIAGLGLVLYLAINGFLFGREYFEMAALRRMPSREATALYRRRRLTVFLAGAGIAAFALVPVLNLATPLFATAVMIHLFEGMGGGGALATRPARG
ncbi:MAG: EI24 domain-containing protein [Alphaproteobacteria bacterium]